MVDHWRRVARWTGMGNNRSEGSTTESKQQMVEEPIVQDQDTLKQDGQQDSQTVETMGAGNDSAGDPLGALRMELDQARGERDQLVDRLARLQAEFDNARKREVKERRSGRD
jgi:molecular chaperone GrpE